MKTTDPDDRAVDSRIRRRIGDGTTRGSWKNPPTGTNVVPIVVSDFVMALFVPASFWTIAPSESTSAISRTPAAGATSTLAYRLTARTLYCWGVDEVVVPNC